MDLGAAMKISGAGMKVQSARMRVVAENLANVASTGMQPGADPYRRKTIEFQNRLDRAAGVELVDVRRYGLDRSDFELRHEPTHPAADEQGYVKYPNVNRFVELMDMREAQRSYEANLNSLRASRSMIQRTIDLLR